MRSAGSIPLPELGARLHAAARRLVGPGPVRVYLYQLLGVAAPYVVLHVPCPAPAARVQLQRDLALLVRAHRAGTDVVVTECVDNGTYLLVAEGGTCIAPIEAEFTLDD